MQETGAQVVIMLGTTPNPRSASSNPFDLHDEQSYRRWRDEKLSHYPTHVEDLVVEVRDPLALSATERDALLVRCAKADMAVYQCRPDPAADREIPRRMGEQLGLRRLDRHLCTDDDGISALRDCPRRAGNEYIPYTNRPINWHTDGYYNSLEHRIHGMLLHCVSSAASGGENALMDHEIAYLLMRDENPHYIEALMASDAMTIPPNVEQGREVRPAQSGPVFSVRGGLLHMRYTARTRSIAWKDDPTVRAAVAFLENLLNGDSEYIFHHRLEAGQGLVCNNVLHRRAGFSDDEGQHRLLYRARYYDRIGI